MIVEISIEFFKVFEFSNFFVFQKVFVSLKSITQTVNAFIKYKFVFIISIHENNSFINVNVINVAAFSRLTKKKNYNLEIFNLKNIKKTFNIKLKSNLSTLI